MNNWIYTTRFNWYEPRGSFISLEEFVGLPDREWDLISEVTRNIIRYAVKNKEETHWQYEPIFYTAYKTQDGITGTNSWDLRDPKVRETSTKLQKLSKLPVVIHKKRKVYDFAPPLNAWAKQYRNVNMITMFGDII